MTQHDQGLRPLSWQTQRLLICRLMGGRIRGCSGPPRRRVRGPDRRAAPAPNGCHIATRPARPDVEGCGQPMGVTRTRVYNFASAPVAQLDRANASGALGREFESLRAHQIFPLPSAACAASPSIRFPTFSRCSHSVRTRTRHGMLDCFRQVNVTAGYRN